MSVIVSQDTIIVVEVYDQALLVESLNTVALQTIEVPVTTQTVALEVPVDSFVVVEEFQSPTREVIELGGAKETIELIAAGPQGPPGDTRFFVGTTPPVDTSLIWVDTSAA